MLSTHQEWRHKKQGKDIHNEILKEDFALIALLKSCIKNKDLGRGTMLHAHMVRENLLEKNPYLATTLINMYAKCGMIEKAKQVLEDIPNRDIVTWCALISGYTKQDRSYEALNCFERMQSEGLSPDAFTFSCILKACGNIGDIKRGKLIHEEIMNRGLLRKNVVLGTSLVDMYVKWGDVAEAKRVLEGLQLRNVVTWTSIIVGYTQQGQCYEALDSFTRMQAESLAPNMVTVVSILKACGNIGEIHKGKQMHVNGGLLMNKENEIGMLGSALIAMYAKCGVLSEAQQVLDEVCTDDVVSWNALISGYAHRDRAQESILSFERMRMHGILPDAFSFACALNACGETGDISKGKQIHEEIKMNEKRMFEKDVVLGNALVDMYTKCGFLETAEMVLKELPIRNVASWNALISGYVRHQRYHEAFDCFEKMRGSKKGCSKPDAITFLCILQACGSIGAIHKGKQIHNEIVSMGFLKNNISLGNAVVDMYAQCGMLAIARQVLEELPFRDVASWNTLMSTYAHKGQPHEVLYCFEHMRSEGLSPNKVTLTSVLSACGRSGLSKEAETLFSYTTKRYGVIPNIEHHSCMVAIFGCVGHFSKAMSLMQYTPSLDNMVLWITLLGACKKWGNVELGTLVFDQVLQLDNRFATTCNTSSISK